MTQDIFSNGIVRLYHISITFFQLSQRNELTFYAICDSILNYRMYSEMLYRIATDYR